MIDFSSKHHGRQVYTDHLYSLGTKTEASSELFGAWWLTQQVSLHCPQALGAKHICWGLQQGTVTTCGFSKKFSSTFCFIKLQECNAKEKS